MRYLFPLNPYNQQRQFEKPVWVYPAHLAMYATYLRDQGHEVIWNADHWHLLVEELFMLPDDARDRFELFTATDDIWTNHKGLGQHIESGARQMREQMGRGTRSRKPRFVRDHWWDALAMGLVGMSIVAANRERRARQKPRRTFAQMTKNR